MLLHDAVWKFQRGKVVIKRLGTAYELDRTILTEEKFCAPELSIIVEAHRAAMSTGVMDDDAVANRDLRELAVDGKLIVVLTK